MNTRSSSMLKKFLVAVFGMVLWITAVSAAPGSFTPSSFSKRVTPTASLTQIIPTSTPFSVPSTPVATSSPSTVSAEEEFVGPFASWANLKRDYGAVGDGIADDTIAIQRAIEALNGDDGVGATPSVLYVPIGTYRITSTIKSIGRVGVAILGEDPTTTILKWDGPQNGTMFDVNLSYSRFSRFTFDGSGKAGVLLLNSFNYARGETFPVMVEYADDIFSDANTCIQLGRFAGGDDETSILRSRFYRCGNGVSLNDWNTLQVFVRDSYFEDNGNGITNLMGAGGFHVYGSAFKHSKVADVHIGNTAVFGIRNNYSEGSARFFWADGPTGAPCPTTLQGNTVIDPTGVAIWVNNRGPALFVDNVVRNPAGNTIQPVYFGTFAESDLLSVGNTFTVANPYRTNRNRFRSINDTTVDRSNIVAVTPTPTQFAPQRAKTVFEVPSNADGATIQSIINAATTSGQVRPIIHFSKGKYQVAQTLVIPAESDVQVVGDTFNSTSLIWTGQYGAGPLLRILGPSYVTIRDIQLTGTTSADHLLSFEGVDQPGAVILLRQFNVRGEYLSDTGIELQRIDNASVYAIHSSFSGPRHSIVARGGPLSLAGQTTSGKFVEDGGNSRIHGFDDYDVNVVESGLQVYDNAKVLIRDNWFESRQSGHLSLSSDQSGTLTIESNVDAVETPILAQSLHPTTFDIDGFKGKVALFGTAFAPSVLIRVLGTESTLQMLLGTSTIHPSTFQSTATKGAVGMLQTAWYDPQAAGNEWDITWVPEKGRIDDAFIMTMLAHLRATDARTPSISTPLHVSNVSVLRVWTGKGISGVKISP